MNFTTLLFLSITFVVIFLILRYEYIRTYKKWVAEDYWDNGVKNFMINYRGRNLDGLTTEWYRSGQIRTESNYEDGKIDGLATLFYESGNKNIEANFRGGQPNGLVTEWSDSGNKIIEVNFRKGQPDEVATEWSESDQVRLSDILRKWATLENGVSFNPVYSMRRRS